MAFTGRGAFAQRILIRYDGSRRGREDSADAFRGKIEGSKRRVLSGTEYASGKLVRKAEVRRYRGFEKELLF